MYTPSGFYRYGGQRGLDHLDGYQLPAAIEVIGKSDSDGHGADIREFIAKIGDYAFTCAVHPGPRGTWFALESYYRRTGNEEARLALGPCP